MWVSTESEATKALGWRDEDGVHHRLEFDSAGHARCTKAEAAEAVERFAGLTAHETKPDGRDENEPEDEES